MTAKSYGFPHHSIQLYQNGPSCILSSLTPPQVPQLQLGLLQPMPTLYLAQVGGHVGCLQRGASHLHQMSPSCLLDALDLPPFCPIKLTPPPWYAHYAYSWQSTWNLHHQFNQWLSSGNSFLQQSGGGDRNPPVHCTHSFI